MSSAQEHAKPRQRYFPSESAWHLFRMGQPIPHSDPGQIEMHAIRRRNPQPSKRGESSTPRDPVDGVRDILSSEPKAIRAR